MDTITQKLLEQKAAFSLKTEAKVIVAAAQKRDAAAFNA